MIYQLNRKNIYLDDDGTEVKPKHFLQRGMRYTSGCYPIQQMWDRGRKTAREMFGKIRKPAGFIYLPGSNSVRLKVIRQSGHFYKMFLLTIPLGLENTPKTGIVQIWTS